MNCDIPLPLDVPEPSLPWYEEETLSDDDDNGTMPENVETLASAVVGHRIIKAETRTVQGRYYQQNEAFVITLDNGKEVRLFDTSDCCAYTTLSDFFLDPASVDHIILGVGTTESYNTWHIYADWGDILQLEVGWSPGNPFYYGYGFDINVVDIEGSES